MKLAPPRLIFAHSIFSVAALLFCAGCGGSQLETAGNDRCAEGEEILTEQLDALGEVRRGEKAPWFAAHDARNLRRPVNLKMLTGAPETDKVALVFFATWCEPCIKGLRVLRAAEQQLSEAGVRVVLVDVQEEPGQVAEFLDVMGLRAFTAVIDKFGANTRAYGVSSRVDGQESVAIPKTFVIDKHGIVVAILGSEGKDYITRILEAK